MSRIVILMLLVVLLAACAPAGTVTPPLLATAPSRDPLIPSPSGGSATPALPSPVASPTLASPNPYQPQQGDDALKRGAAMLDVAQIVARESLPAQYSLLLKGTLPTPCHQLRVAIGAPDAAKVVNVQVYSVVDPNKICAQVLAPFEAALRLDGYAAGKYTVMANDASAGQIEVSAAPSMKGYEIYSWQSEGSWYFSLLLGTNRNKTVAEITAPSARLAGVQALKDQLKLLPAGEWVIAPSVQGLPGLSLPPDPLLAEIRAYCLERGLQFSAATQSPA